MRTETRNRAFLLGVMAIVTGAAMGFAYFLHLSSEAETEAGRPVEVFAAEIVPEAVLIQASRPQGSQAPETVSEYYSSGGPLSFKTEQWLLVGGTALILAGLLLVSVRLPSKVSGRPNPAHETAKRNRLSALRTRGVMAIGAATVMIAVAMYSQSGLADAPIVYSDKAMMKDLWEAYKREYIEPTSGRTMDKQRNFVTTSEGQSYTMLRAVWVDDRETFDRSLQWTRDILRRSDGLHSWLFGERSDGSYGILTASGGQNAASDADSDIALALIFAFARWSDPEHLRLALETLDGIWNKEVVMIGGAPYFASNDVSGGARKVLINPSYLSPYAYKIFAKVDPLHDWSKLVDTSYAVLEKSMANPLDKYKSANLPPDWLVIDRQTGAIEPSPERSLSTNYGYDAMRVPWRVALDYIWFNDDRAKATLERMRYLGSQWEAEDALYSTYSHSGQPVLMNESPAMYGSSIGYFLVTQPDEEKGVYGSKLRSLYDPDTQSWKKTLGYYDDNMAWFGMALRNGMTPNLFEMVSK